jgi:hypothetical protein
MTVQELVNRLQSVRRSGNGHVASCPGHDDQRPSLSIREIRNTILLHCFRGCSLGSICEALGIRASDLFVESSHANTRPFSDAERRDYAGKLWLASKPARATIVETYLRNRGITMAFPRSIRFTTVRCDDYPRAMRWPALIAGIQDANGAFAGVTITALCADGSGRAPVETPRKIYGPFGRGTVRLNTHSHEQVAIGIGEGIETMLSVMQATGIACWAALTASNLARVVLPPTIRQIVVCADADLPGEAAAQALAQRLMREEREVRIARTGRAGVDFNDLRL